MVWISLKSINGLGQVEPILRQSTWLCEIGKNLSRVDQSEMKATFLVGEKSHLHSESRQGRSPGCIGVIACFRILDQPWVPIA
jgi:hypothetical protein